MWASISVHVVSTVFCAVIGLDGANRALLMPVFEKDWPKDYDSGLTCIHIQYCDNIKAFTIPVDYTIDKKLRSTGQTGFAQLMMTGEINNILRRYIKSPGVRKVTCLEPARTAERINGTFINTTIPPALSLPVAKLTAVYLLHPLLYSLSHCQMGLSVNTFSIVMHGNGQPMMTGYAE